MQIVLAHPRIPQNAGAVARLAAATNTKLVLARPFGFRLTDKAVRRAGLDYWESADIEIAASLDEAIESAPGAVYYFSRHGQTSYLDTQFHSEDTLVFGSETDGLPDEIIQNTPTERLLRIPILSPKVRSLNLATSVAIALYEALRQTNSLKT